MNLGEMLEHWGRGERGELTSFAREVSSNVVLEGGCGGEDEGA
jgi:hypothetical protein